MIARTLALFFLYAAMNLPATAQEKADSIPPGAGDSARMKPDTVIMSKEPRNELTDDYSVKSYARSYWTDSKSVVTAPFHWKTGQIIAAGAITAGTIGLIAWGDKPIQQFFYRNQSTLIAQSSDYFFSPLGSGIISIPALGVFFACGVIWKNKKAKETGLKGLEAFVLTAVLTNVIKQVAHRHRPYQDIPPDPLAWDGPFSWDGPYGPFGYNSFPSGHSSAVFAVATVIGLEYWNTGWVPAVSFGLAGVTAMYRLAVNDHWASDVLFGSALGLAIGSTVYFNSGKKLQVIPVCSTGTGVTLIYHF